MPTGQVDVSIPLLVNAGAGNGATKQWPGGEGVLIAVASWGGGNAQLQVLGPDGATWINVGSAITANGVATFKLGKSQVRVVVTTASGVYVTAERILSA